MNLWCQAGDQCSNSAHQEPLDVPQVGHLPRRHVRGRFARLASTIARSGVDQPYQTKADFDQAFAAVGASATVMTGKAAIDAEKLRQAGLKRINLARQ